MSPDLGLVMVSGSTTREVETTRDGINFENLAIPDFNRVYIRGRSIGYFELAFVKLSFVLLTEHLRYMRRGSRPEHHHSHRKAAMQSIMSIPKVNCQLRSKTQVSLNVFGCMNFEYWRAGNGQVPM